jgi:hypothetical protein
MKFFFVLFLSLVSYPVFGQSGFDRNNRDMRLLYPGLQDISEQGRTSFIVALSYFPELAHSRIQLKYTKIKTTLNVRPTLCSLIFNRKINRKYIIRINSSLKDSVITLNELSSDAQVGVLGHELSHIVDYRQRNIWGTIARGFAYLSKRRKANYEKEIDGIAIQHGLGCQLYQWAIYVQQGSDASEQYKLFKSKTYMKPDEIQKLYESKQE